MDNLQLKGFIEDYEKKFSRIYVQDDYKFFKVNAEKFFHLYKEYGGKQIKMISKLGLRKFLTNELLSRIFLGIGCELLVKSIYLKNGFAINILLKEKSKNKKLNFPYMINEVSKEIIDGTKTYDFKKLNKSLYNLKPNDVTSSNFNKYILKPLEIARIWRNKETHIGGGYHTESGEIGEIKYALINIYNLYYNEKFDIF